MDSRGGGKQEESIFTFQYVSINTNDNENMVAEPSVFTFQYVSINTRLVM